MESDYVTRKRHRLERFDYSSPGAYFVTICTKERVNYFWKRLDADPLSKDEIELSEYGRIVDALINNISAIYPTVVVEHYIIMPDHIHLLINIHRSGSQNDAQPSLDQIIRHLKGKFSKEVGTSIWQKLFFDHVIRNKEDYEEHIKYIYENPLRLHYKMRDSSLQDNLDDEH